MTRAHPFPDVGVCSIAESNKTGLMDAGTEGSRGRHGNVTGSASKVCNAMQCNAKQREEARPGDTNDWPCPAQQ